MANYYKLNISFSVRKDLQLNEFSALSHLVNGAGDMPENLPDHEFFYKENVKNIVSIPYVYRDFTFGEYSSSFWIAEMSQGITILLPGIKDSEGWYQKLKFVDWLCTFCIKDCFLGYISQEYDEYSVSLLYSVKRKLYFKNSKDLKYLNSFSTGEPL